MFDKMLKCVFMQLREQNTAKRLGIPPFDGALIS